jgi:SAM-dependent methyltransferase
VDNVPPDLAGHQDRLRWNAKYRGGRRVTFTAHPLAVAALALPLPAGPMLELACGPSGSALLAAAGGREVTAVDVSDLALDMLAAEASRRGLGDLITTVHADATTWRPEPGDYPLVLCTGFWDRAAFAAAVTAVAPAGALAWEAFTAQARATRPDLHPAWTLEPGEPAALLPPDFAVLEQAAVAGSSPPRRRMLARRAAGPPPRG